MLTSSTQLQNTSFHFVERTRTSTNSKCAKMKNARAKRAKLLFFHCQIIKFVTFLLLSSSWLLKLPIVSFASSISFVPSFLLSGQIDQGRLGNLRSNCPLLSDNVSVSDPKKPTCKITKMLREVSRRTPLSPIPRNGDNSDSVIVSFLLCGCASEHASQMWQ